LNHNEIAGAVGITRHVCLSAMQQELEDGPATMQRPVAQSFSRSA
jgi:hypothetical protein